MIGPNGSGKSTLLRLLATDLTRTDGSLELLGHDSINPTSELRRRIAWVSDSPVHIHALSGWENLEFFGGLRGRAGSRSRERFHELLALFGLQADAQVHVSDYSFGMARKLALVEALAAEPDLLVLDEPSVGLDPEGVAALRDEVAAAAARGATVFLATNEILEVPTWADRILFLHRGRLLDEGSRTELLERVRGKTRIEVELTGPPPRIDPPPGITRLHLGFREVVAESEEGSRPLPRLLRGLLEEGPSIRNVRVREPDLSDVFRSLAGVGLDGGDE